MIAQTLNNRYKIASRLGKGAMGIVYKAADIKNGREVALKIISSDLDIEHELLARFKREGETLQQLQHPNIVEFLDAFEYEENYVIVMEYVSGGNLHDLIKKGKLSIKHATHIALGLCDALIHSHKLGIIHRDIKPENILLKDDGTPKLADFGVARLNEATRMTRSGTQVGTPYYMAPEAWEGKHLDAQADIWSLGVVIFEMLTGEVPFGGDTGAAVMNKVLTTNPPNIKSLRKEIPSRVVKIINRMLTRDKKRRYQTMWEVITDLERNQPKPHRLSTKAKPYLVKQSVSIKIWLGGLIGLIGILAISGFFIKQISMTPSASTSSITSTAYILSTQTQQHSISSTPTIVATPFSMNEPVQHDNWELVYVGGTESKQDLFIVGLDNSSPENLSLSPGYHLYFGTWGLDLQSFIASNSSNNLVAYIFDADGSQEVYVVNTGQNSKIKADIDGSVFYGLNYSYSGNYLAVWGSSLQIIDNSGAKVATSSLEELKRGSYFRSGFSVSNTFIWSPMNDKIAFWYFPVLGTTAGAQLCILDVVNDSYFLVDFPVNSTAGGNIVWVNENQVLVSIRSNNTQIYKIDINGNQQQTTPIISETSIWYPSFDLSPDKSAISIYNQYRKGFNIFDLEGNLITNIKDEYWSSWSPTGNYYISYSEIDNEDTADKIFIRSIQKTSITEIVPDVSYRYWIYAHSITWSPIDDIFSFLVCSENIFSNSYLYKNDYGLCDLYIASYDGNFLKYTQEPDYFSTSVAPSWSPDGTLVAYIVGKETGNLVVAGSDSIGGIEYQNLADNAYYNSPIIWIKSSSNHEGVNDTTISATTTQESITIDITATLTPFQSLNQPVSIIQDGRDAFMSYVPAGEFTMGTNNGESDQQPAHQVYLDGYYIDQYEVTIAQYKICVTENVCEIPSYASFTHSDYYLNSEYSNYPVINIDWEMARTFCEWRAARLPTEAEWEKAARGTDARLFPWGNELNSTFVNFNKLYKDTTPVGNFETGKSPYGVYDMAGNVWEWVQDWYDSAYYQNSPLSNPSGPDSGRNRVIRGGSWIVDEDLILATYRDGNGLSNSNLRGTGFRCAMSVSP